MASLTKAHNRMIQGETRSADDFGAVGDGSTDDRAALNSANTNGPFSLASGTHYVQSNLTISSDIYFESGATLKPIAGVTITISGEVHASQNQQIFDISAHATTAVVDVTSGQVHYPEWWGAVGDAATDDTKALQACSDSAGEGDRRGVVQLGPKTYNAVGWDLSEKPITIKGYGERVTRVIQHADTAHVINIVNASQKTGWNFYDFKVDGNATTTYDGIHMEECALCNFYGVGAADATYGINLSTNTVLCTFMSCVFGGGNTNGLGFTSAGTATHHRVLGCWIDENDTRGMYINSSYNTVVGNNFQDNTSQAVRVDVSGDYNNITANFFRAGSSPDTDTGVEVYGDNNKITENNFDAHTTREIDIAAAGAANNIVRGNDNLTNTRDLGTSTVWAVGADYTYTPTNVSTDRAFDADTVAVAELADVVGTLIADLQTQGVIS